jgi:LPPG:FO 2-phospho-L-lactate transferase
VARGAALTVLLSGGSGGAKLARGLLDVSGELTVVANTADDVEMYGVHVSPDPDLVTWWLADEIDERGWGLRDDTWHVMEALEAAGRSPWFRLGDRDLAMCLLRTERLRAGSTLTDAHAAVVDAMGVRARVLPMSDQPVTTWVGARGGTVPFQEFMILQGGEGPIEAVELRGVEEAGPTDAVLEAIAGAEAIVIGPSNPVISIGPILELQGMRAALRETAAPVVAVSPFVGGQSLKGITDECCRFAGIERTATGIAEAYGDVLDGIVSDEEVTGLPGLVTGTLMASSGDRLALATKTLEFAAKLAA